MTALPLMSMFVADAPRPPRSPALPKVTMHSARTCSPAGMPSSELSNVAVKNRLTVPFGGIVCWGESAQIVLLSASVNSSEPEPAFSVNVPFAPTMAYVAGVLKAQFHEGFSCEPAATMFAVVAPSPDIALATSTDAEIHFDPDQFGAAGPFGSVRKRCRFTTMLPIVAWPAPLFLIDMNP